MTSENSIRILHLLHRSVPGTSGYTIRSREIVKHQLANGLEPLVITSPSQAPAGKLDSQGSEVISGVRYFRTCSDILPPSLEVKDRNPVKSLLRVAQNVSLYKTARRVAEQYRPSVIHAHSPFTCGIIGNAVGKKNGVPTIYEMRGLWEESHSARRGVGEASLRYKAVRFLDNRALKRADICCVIGTALEEEVCSRGVNPDRIVIVPNGVDVKSFVPGNASEDLRNNLGLKNKVTFGYVGSFFRFEGLGLMVEALAELGEEFPELRLLFVGDGELMPQLKETVARFGLQDRVIFTGRVRHEETADLYRLCDFLVLPREDTRLTRLVTPLKPLEIMSMGKPLIASDIGGHREMIFEGVNGILFKSEDVGDLAAKIRTLVTNPDLRKDLGSKARRWVEENRDWGVLVRRYIDLYSRLIADDRR